MGSSTVWRGLGGDHGYAGRSLASGSEAIRLGQGWSWVPLESCGNRAAVAELLHAARAPYVAVAHERRGLAIPLGIHPVDGVLEHRWGAVVVFRGDEDEAVGLSDGGGPFLDHLVLVSRAPPH